jgi:hypothetical protein
MSPRVTHPVAQIFNLRGVLLFRVHFLLLRLRLLSRAKEQPQWQPMGKIAMPRRFGAIGAITILWFLASFRLTLMLAEAEDSLGKPTATPRLLEWVCAIVFFPMRYLQQWDQFDASISDGVKVLFLAVGFLVNGLLWSLFFLYALPLTAKRLASLWRCPD